MGSVSSTRIAGIFVPHPSCLGECVQSAGPDPAGQGLHSECKVRERSWFWLNVNTVQMFCFIPEADFSILNQGPDLNQMLCVPKGK